MAISYLEDCPIKYRGGNLYLLYYKFINPNKTFTIRNKIHDKKIQKYNKAIEEKVRKTTELIKTNNLSIDALTLYLSDSSVIIYGTNFEVRKKKNIIKTSKIIKLDIGKLGGRSYDIGRIKFINRDYLRIPFSKFSQMYHTVILLKIIKDFYFYVERYLNINEKANKRGNKLIYKYSRIGYKIGEIYLDYSDQFVDSNEYFLKLFYDTSLMFAEDLEPKVQRIIKRFFDNKIQEATEIGNISEKLLKRH